MSSTEDILSEPSKEALADEPSKEMADEPSKEAAAEEPSKESPEWMTIAPTGDEIASKVNQGSTELKDEEA